LEGRQKLLFMYKNGRIKFLSLFLFLKESSKIIRRFKFKTFG
jgi:hypothetical protein